MDFLRSFNIEELPEQQTRTSHLIQDNPDFALSLGFDACCTCGKIIGTPTSPILACPACKRVNYCSEECRQIDANYSGAPPSENYDEGGPEEGLGHSPIVCSLLRLCEQDDAVDNGEFDGISTGNIEESKSRIESERHAYPATLANAIMGADTCFSKALRNGSKRGTLVIHVLGASEEGELWDVNECFQAYADALADLAETHKIAAIDLAFIGPECPEKSLTTSVPMTSSAAKDSSSTNTLRISVTNGRYSSQLLRDHGLASPDIVFFFNPGFTVPDYDWKDALGSIKEGTPFLSTTNTELEGIADCQFLLDQDKIQSIPPGLAQVFGLYSDMDDDEDNDTETTSFFGPNPFCGNRVRQNGTMANDLFVKSHWMIGGIMGSFNPERGATSSSQPSKKIRGEDANQKSMNPALI